MVIGVVIPPAFCTVTALLGPAAGAVNPAVFVALPAFT
jgi:hypothetical protein